MRIFLLALLAVLAFAGPAQAMDKGAQQETSSPAYCDQIAKTGSKWARIMVQPELYAGRRDSYIATAKRCHDDDGLKVMVSIMHWYQTSPRLSADQLAFAAAVAAHDLGPWVDAWSPINEPNHPAFAVDWKPYLTATARVAHTTVHNAKSFERVKHGRFKRRWSKRLHAWRFKRVKHHHGHWRKVVRTWTTTAYTTTTVAIRQDVAMARASRAAYDAATVAIRSEDPTALMIFGDTAWSDGGFMRLMISAKAGLPDADVAAIHYSLPNKDVRDVAKMLDVPMWVNEWGSVPSKQENVAATLNAQKAAGVKVSVYYNGLDWNGTWRDQRLTPSNYRAFKAW